MVHRTLVETYLESQRKELLHEAQKHRLLKEVSNAKTTGSRFRNSFVLPAGLTQSLWSDHIVVGIYRVQAFMNSAISRKQPCETC